MSLDLGIWRTNDPLGNQGASDVYHRLNEGDISALQPHPAIDAFYTDLVARFPELDDVPDDKIDDSSYCPWSCRIDRSPRHLVLSFVFSSAEMVGDFVGALQEKHRVTVYDPQEGKEYFPDE